MARGQFWIIVFLQLVIIVMLWIERGDTRYIRAVADNIDAIGADTANQADQLARRFGL